MSAPAIAGLDVVLQRAETIRLFPAAAARIQVVADSPTSSVGDLEAAVSTDPALTAVVLKMANSAFYGQARTIASLKQAILVLGFRATKDIALAIAILSLGQSTHPLRRPITRHSLRVAAAARSLASRSRGVDPGEAFVAGLLHDIGILIELELWPGTAGPALALAHAGERLGAERQAFGFDHTTLGAACLERWSLPPAICAAARRHHDALHVAGRGGPALFVAVADELLERAERGHDPRHAFEEEHSLVHVVPFAASDVQAAIDAAAGAPNLF